MAPMRAAKKLQGLGDCLRWRTEDRKWPPRPRTEDLRPQPHSYLNYSIGTKHTGVNWVRSFIGPMIAVTRRPRAAKRLRLSSAGSPTRDMWRSLCTSRRFRRCCSSTARCWGGLAGYLGSVTECAWRNRAIRIPSSRRPACESRIASSPGRRVSRWRPARRGRRRCRG